MCQKDNDNTKKNGTRKKYKKNQRQKTVTCLAHRCNWKSNRCATIRESMIKRLLNSRFVRNVLLVATGTAGAQAITMAFSPIITRLYGPEAYGLLGTFSAVLSIAMPIAALTYPIAIVLPKRDDDARGIAKLSVLLALLICLVVATVLLLGGQPIARLLDLEAISAFLLLIPFAMFLNVLQQIMQQWLIRKKQFKVSARIAISQSLILNVTKTGVGFVHPAGASLIILATLGNALYATQLWLGRAAGPHRKTIFINPITACLGPNSWPCSIVISPCSDPRKSPLTPLPKACPC